MGTNALNPGSGKGPPGAPHRGQVREGRGSRAARPGPTLRSLICFQEKPRLQPFALAFQVPIGTFRQPPLPALLQRVFLDIEAVHFPRRLSFQTKNSLFHFFPFPTATLSLYRVQTPRWWQCPSPTEFDFAETPLCMGGSPKLH